PARARHGRGRQPHAIAGREAEDSRRRDQERAGPRQTGGGQGRGRHADAESAPACRPLSIAVAVMTADDVKPRRRRLTAEEHTLWSRITRSVAPLRRKPVPAAATPVPSPPGKKTPAA